MCVIIQASRMEKFHQRLQGAWSRSRSRRANFLVLIGWSKSYFNNLHFRISLETINNNYMFQTHEAFGCPFPFGLVET